MRFEIRIGEEEKKTAHKMLFIEPKPLLVRQWERR